MTAKTLIRGQNKTASSSVWEAIQGSKEQYQISSSGKKVESMMDSDVLEITVKPEGRKSVACRCNLP